MFATRKVGRSMKTTKSKPKNNAGPKWKEVNGTTTPDNNFFCEDKCLSLGFKLP
jgi:hypothetical protein